MDLVRGGDRRPQARSLSRWPYLASLLAVALIVVASSGCSGGAAQIGDRGSAPLIAPTKGVRVAGNRLVTGAGAPLQMGGVSRSGTEYSCLSGTSVFVGPASGATIEAMARWHVEIVRLPLNEDCWLGINGVTAKVSGAAYQSAVSVFVSQLEAHGMVVDLDLHWSGPGSELATGQQEMPDATHSGVFWQQVASKFGNDPDVMLELYNEPYGVSWSCWRDGCAVPPQGRTPTYQAIGMQQLVDTVRAVGARNPLVIDGLDHAANLRGWREYAPRDPDHALIAGWHLYGPSTCLEACWQRTASQVSGIPLMVTEFGQTDCGSQFVVPFMKWLDAHGITYLAWAWDPWPGCSGPSLIDDYAGRPHDAYGQAVLRHLQLRFPGRG